MDFHKYQWIMDTAERFTTSNPILLDDQVGYEKDTKRMKIGDGKTEWNDLRYFDANDPNGVSSSLEEDINVIGVTVGNVSDGDVLKKGTSITEAFKQIMAKRIAPTYTKPTMSFSINPSAVQESGKEITVQVTASFTKNDSGDIAKYEIYKNGDLVHEDTSISSFEDTFVIASNTTYMAKIYYAEGAVKKDNFGDEDPTGKITAGNLSASKSLTCVNPFFFGVCSDIDNYSIDGLTKSVSVKGNKSFSYTGVDVYCTIAYDADYSDLTSITDSNGFECISGFTKKLITINETDYKLYYTTEKATVSGFAYTFKF